MLALGCLAPFLLLVGGAVIGAFLDATTGSIWGAAIGLALGLAVPAILLVMLFAARRKG